MTMRTSGIDRYLSEISKISMISPEEEAELAKRSFNGDRDAINELVRVNLRFVVSVAKTYHGGSEIKFEDLINEGNRGLIEAAELFDPKTGFKFISYAVWHIRKYMTQYLTNTSRIVRIPQNKVVAVNQMKQIESDLSSELDRFPTQDEIIDAYIDQSMERKGTIESRSGIEFAMFADRNTTSLESPFNSSDNATVSPIDVLQSDCKESDHLAMDSDTYKMIMPFLETLSYIDKQIILLRFGFLTLGEPVSFNEIGERLGYGSERMRQRYKKALKVLNSRMRRGNKSIDSFI
jgi:RNA polymerase primary sigma factor